MSRLRPLAELYLDHLDLIGGGLLRESAGIELAVGGPAAEIATAQFPDQVAAMFTVVAADAALARVMGEIAQFGALVERQDGVRAQRAEAHRRDVEDRGRIRL